MLVLPEIMGMTNQTTLESTARKPYTAPKLERVGTLSAMTQGFAGSVPDEQGGNTKRNPFQG
jgi:hypothetical protein